MKTSVAFAFLMAASAAASVSPAHAATTLNFLNNGCLEGGCFSQSSSLSRAVAVDSLAGPLDVGGFKLQRDLLGSHQSSIFRLTFWVDDTLKVGDFGNFMIAGLPGDEVTLTGEQFVYDPAWGRLTAKIELIDLGGVGGGGGFGAGSGEVAAPVTGGAPEPSAVVGAALVPVPEPAAWAMMIMGFASAGALLRHRRTMRSQAI